MNKIEVELARENIQLSPNLYESLQYCDELARKWSDQVKRRKSILFVINLFVILVIIISSILYLEQEFSWYYLKS